MPKDDTGVEKQNNSKGKRLSDYPAHVESFETYYYLGEHRTLKLTASIRFKDLVPNCHPGVPEFKKKFDSFYRKVKRWATKENWNEWVRRKEIEERRTREIAAGESVKHLSEALRSYQDFVRQSLSHFAERAKIPMLLQEAIISGDAEAEAELREKVKKGEAVEIKTFREAKELIELDIHLSKMLDQEPMLTSVDGGSISEEEAMKVDRIMEWMRAKAAESFKTRNS
jgi:hypothetical protein